METFILLLYNETVRVRIRICKSRQNGNTFNLYLFIFEGLFELVDKVHVSKFGPFSSLCCVCVLKNRAICFQLKGFEGRVDIRRQNRLSATFQASGQWRHTHHHTPWKWARPWSFVTCDPRVPYRAVLGSWPKQALHRCLSDFVCVLHFPPGTSSSLSSGKIPVFDSFKGRLKTHFFP